MTFSLVCIKNKSILALLSVVSSLIALSCARWGKPLEWELIGEEKIRVEEIIRDIEENDAKIRTLKGRGTFTLKTPQLDTIYQLHQSDIEFNYPDYLFAVGRKYTAVVLKLTCYKDEFLIELPTEKRYYYSKGGEYFEHSGARVTPLDIFREMLLTGKVENLKFKSVRLVSYDTANQIAELMLYFDRSRKHPYRKILVQGKPWVILETERYSENGDMIAKTKRSDYRVSEDGVKFPSVIHCEFPRENAFMTIKLNKCVFNELVKPYTAQINKLVNTLKKEKFKPIDVE